MAPDDSQPHPEGSKWIYGSAFGTSAAGKSVIYTVNDFVLQDGRVKSGGILATEDGGATGGRATTDS